MIMTNKYAGTRQVQASASGVLIALILFTMLFVPGSAADAQSGDIGYRGFSFPRFAGGNSQVTGEKPESKLWWNDGYWYGSLWSTSGNAYHIYRMELASQTWTDTGVPIDDRLESKADVLWDGTYLYVASHLYVDDASLALPAPAGQRGELYRYSYNPVTKTYSLNSGFPVQITGGPSETLVIDKDSSGQLWVTYVQQNTVTVNHSLGNDHLHWVGSYPLPAGGAENVTSDDISSLITYNQHVGVMWSNQKNSNLMYFAVHLVGTPDSSWSRVRAYAVSGDDHINLKTLQSDDAGNVFAVVKTDTSSALIVVLVCKNNINRCKSETDWDAHTVSKLADNNPTRPMMLIDETNRYLYVFTRNEDGDGGSAGIYYKRADLDNISFPTGIGTPFIRTAQDVNVNDVTSTKQNLNASTGLLVLASDQTSKYYLHNYISLNGAQPDVQSISPTRGTIGTIVTLNGSNLSSVTSVQFSNLIEAEFTIGSSTQIQAVVPPGATLGAITVNSPTGSATSLTVFEVTQVNNNTFISLYLPVIQLTAGN